jgi:hypothetical protein
MLAEAADVNSMYEEALLNLKNRKAAVPKQIGVVVSNAEKEQIAKDYYANVRTNVSCICGACVKTDTDSESVGFIDLGTVQCTCWRVQSCFIFPSVLIPVLFTGPTACCNSWRYRHVKHIQWQCDFQSYKRLYDFYPHLHGYDNFNCKLDIVSAWANIADCLCL